MRKIVWLTAVAVLFIPANARSQQNDPAAQQKQGPSSDTAQAPAAQQDSVAEAARKARDQKKETSKTAKVFTNDNLPTAGGISTVGSSGTSDNAAAPSGESAAKPADEKAWRTRFAELHHKLEQDQAALDVDQRELGQLNIQFYGDPVKGLQQGLTRSDINEKTAEIDKMKAQVEADKQAIDDAEEELRKSGGDPGWAR